MGGHMQQSNGASLWDPPGGGPIHNVGSTSDAGDAVMARWLQSAGLQHLGSPLASAGIDNRLLPNLVMQGHGGQSVEEKQKLYKIFRNLNMNGEFASEPYTPTGQSSGPVASADGFYSPELRGEFGAGLLDLHAMDDTELLSGHVLSDSFEPSPFMPALAKGISDDFDVVTSRQQREQVVERLPSNDKDNNSNLAKIKVVVRKRPLNKKELSRREEDIVNVYENAYLTVHEPKLKILHHLLRDVAINSVAIATLHIKGDARCVALCLSVAAVASLAIALTTLALDYLVVLVDLTAYVEKHEFCFDAVLDEHVTNDERGRKCVERGRGKDIILEGNKLWNTRDGDDMDSNEIVRCAEGGSSVTMSIEERVEAATGYFMREAIPVMAAIGLTSMAVRKRL
ncbi:hypothetical protein GIB67_024421 [Kingdonia uniflora]|uniref:Uncharacterized protein n=1 Tax=Kingdonia uniflora TaxID=39325 RepID=A0A7J7P4N0_9MAGN|nr:hypothetical protein GIB67_024421 [Kingdonia uniflora]